MAQRTSPTARRAAERRVRFRAPPKPLYDRDMYRWTRQQAKLLRAGKLSELDLENLAEEIESLGKRDRREIHSRLRLVLMHLLKWQFQPDKRTHSWRVTIITQHREIQDILEQSPSLRRSLIVRFTRTYGEAVRQAIEETRLPPGVFPASPPYTLDQALDPDFMPKD
ncbi:MAG: DUF29 domain-containing protein [Alphaproteobacteria bacterium]|nr:DUF29 domain-containing protein [Alphaproteobacteria bacterium]